MININLTKLFVSQMSLKNTCKLFFCSIKREQDCYQLLKQDNLIALCNKKCAKFWPINFLYLNQTNSLTSFYCYIFKVNMFQGQDVADLFDFPRSDCGQSIQLRSTSECQQIFVRIPVRQQFYPLQNYFDEEVKDQPLILVRQPDSFSQIINRIEEPTFLQPEGQFQEFVFPQEPIVSQQQQKTSKQVVKKAHKKNSNAIKKIGRILLNFTQKFNLKTGQNPGVKSMMKLLAKKAKEGQNPKDFIDRFNISHLQALFSDCTKEVSSFNLRVAKSLFNKQLRKQILSSFQIKDKIVYMNTLKCSSLRFCNKKLALRLQLSEILD